MVITLGLSEKIKKVLNQCKVNFNFSKDALIGLGNYAIRLADGFNEHYHCHIDPLGDELSNQAMGFLLTPSSPKLIFGCEDFRT